MVIGFGKRNEKMFDENIIREIKNYADMNNVPIMADSGMRYLMNYVDKHSVRNILEIGTAIGYSAIMLCSVHPDVVVTTIERDEKRYLEAIKNIKKMKLEERIHLIYKDAFDVSFDEQFDLIFIDAAKAQNQRLFERFERNLAPEGTIITDNMNFHGLVEKNLEEIKSRDLRQLVRKVKDYHTFLENHYAYETEFLDVGDGIAVSLNIA